MNATERAARILMVGFRGIELPPDLAEDLGAGRLAGVVLFRRNLPDADGAVRLCRTLTAAHARTLIAVDQEGGRVQRLRAPFPELPPMAEVGRTRRKTVARGAGALLGKGLRHVGVHLDFAPVLDVASRPDNPAIGDRSFGSDPSRVARLGAAFIDGIQSEGVAACAKHFPGHGDTGVDSHRVLPSVDRSLDELRHRELVPFRSAVAADVAAMMSAHVRYPAVDPAPATLAARWLRDELRSELRFEGLVVSDDLEMGALAGPLEGSAVAALAAGCDLLLVCSRSERRWQVAGAIAEAVAEGRLSELRLDAALARVEAFKDRWVRPPQPSTWVELERERQALWAMADLGPGTAGPDPTEGGRG